MLNHGSLIILMLSIKQILPLPHHLLIVFFLFLLYLLQINTLHLNHRTTLYMKEQLQRYTLYDKVQLLASKYQSYIVVNVHTFSSSSSSSSSSSFSGGSGTSTMTLNASLRICCDAGVL